MDAPPSKPRGRKIDDNTWNVLPGTLLQEIISFLPIVHYHICNESDNKLYDTADDVVQERSNISSIFNIAIVCRHWYNEIFYNQPMIWKHILDQLNWPYNNVNGENVEDDNCSLLNIYRDAFISHYSIARDMKAFRLGFAEIQTKHDRQYEKRIRNRLDSFQSEVIYHKFTRTKNRPDKACDEIDDKCIGIKQWSTNSIIAAYSKKCTLCMYTAVQNDNHPLHIRRNFYKIDPYRYLKEPRKCILKGFEIDNQYAICMGEANVYSTNSATDSDAFLFVVHRNQFKDCDMIHNDSTNTTGATFCSTLINDMSNVDAINLRLVFLDHLYDVAQKFEEHPYVDLVKYIQRNGASEDCIKIESSNRITSCGGNGKFLFEIRISVRSEIRDVTVFRLIHHTIVLFSAITKSLSWSSNCFGSPERSRFGRDSIVTVHSGTFAVWDRMRKRVAFGDVASPNGPLHCQFIPLLEPSRSFEPRAESQGILTDDNYFMKSTPTSIIIVESHKDYFRNSSLGRTIVSFYDRYQHPSNSTTCTNDINSDAALKCTERDIYENVFVRELLIVNDKYLIMEERNAVIVIHIPSRKEIFRTRLLRPYYGQETYITYDGVMGCCLSSNDGIVLTGSDIREVIPRSIQI